MGFLCSLCREPLKQSNVEGNELVSTVCGHLFDGKCLKYILERQQTPQCPACYKLFGVEDVPIPIFPIDDEGIHEEQPEENSRVSNAVKDIISVLKEENNSLRTRLKNLISVVEKINAHLNDTTHNTNSIGDFKSIDPYAEFSHLLIMTKDDETANNHIAINSSRHRQSLPFSISSDKSDCDSLITNREQNGLGLNDYYTGLTRFDGRVASIDSNSVLDREDYKEDKNKTYRSVKREFLTMRNKTTSWLTKIQSKANKLVTETIKSDAPSIVQQIAEIKFFMNKLESQAILLERMSQAAKILVTFEGVTPMEKTLTERCAKELERDFCDTHLKTNDRIVTLEISLIRCKEMNNFIEESNNLMNDTENRIKALKNSESWTESECQWRLNEISGLLQKTDSHKKSIDEVKISKNDFLSCDYSEILPETAAKLDNIFLKFTSVVEELIEMAELMNNLANDTKSSKREPVFV